VSTERKPASALTAKRNREAAASLPPERPKDLADAERGLVARFEPARVEGEGGRVVWDMASYDFLAEECPESPPLRPEAVQSPARRIISSST
jgi:alkyl sulfatase BDS1-like metallo-beta-lactamase superfamily hydrolase